MVDVLQHRVDFIGIGVQKAGTSWVFQCLLEHPGVKAGLDKECNFFNHYYSFGYLWYQKRFSFGAWKTGEFSTLYFIDEGVPQRIRRYNPDVRLIVTFRDPIDRAFSQHTHQIRRNRLPPELFDFERALDENPTYVDQGRYATHLKRYLACFDRDQIHPIVYDDIAARPTEVLEGLYRFLDLDPAFRPGATEKKINVARRYRHRRLDRWYRKAKGLAQKTLPAPVLDWIKATGIQDAYQRYNEIPVDRREVPPPSDAVRERLRGVFRPEVDELAEWLGRDLTHWMS